MKERGTPWYRFILWIVRVLFFKPFFRLKVTGAENVPRTGPVIIAPTHFSVFDPPVTAVSMPHRALVFMAKEELFDKKWFGWLIGSVGAFPIRRGAGDTEAIKMAVKFLAEGHALILFPEGTRGDGVTLGPIRSGVLLLAKKSGAPVVPVGISGTQIAFPKGAKKIKFTKIKVVFGKPFTYAEAAADLPEKEGRAAFTKRMEEELLALAREAGLPLKSAPEPTHLESSDPAEPAPTA